MRIFPDDDVRFSWPVPAHVGGAGSAADAEAWRGINDKECLARPASTASYECVRVQCAVDVPACCETPEYWLPVQRDRRAALWAVLQGLMWQCWAPAQTPSSARCCILRSAFHTWRTLAQEAGLKPAAAVEAMVKMVALSVTGLLDERTKRGRRRHALLGLEQLRFACEELSAAEEILRRPDFSLRQTTPTLPHDVGVQRQIEFIR